MQFEKGPIEGMWIITPLVRGDARGFFMETFRSDLLPEDMRIPFVQDNHSRSMKGVLRGVHFQWEPPMGKLMRVSRGRAFLVAVDIRCDSATLGKWFGMEISAENKKQIYAPAGFARGFLALEDDTEIQYKCTGIYNQGGESGIRWNDPEIGIQWPLEGEPILSEKDKNAQTLKEWLARPEAKNFRI